MERFTFDPSRHTDPLWSPDGTRIVFNSDRDGAMNLYQRAVSGAGGDEVLLKSDSRKVLTTGLRTGGSSSTLNKTRRPV